jgi:hypothetical protein
MELRRAASQPPSIRGRLVKSLLWISITFGLLTSVVVWYVIAHEMGELMDQELREAAEIFHSVMTAQPDLATDGQSATHHFGYEEHLVWQVVDASSGRVRSRSHKAPEQALQRAPTEAVAWTQDGQWRAFTSVFNQRPEQFLVVAQSRKERDEVHGEVVHGPSVGPADELADSAGASPAGGPGPRRAALRPLAPRHCSNGHAKTGAAPH